MGQAVLAPGFRFHPTDQELVVHYLRRKVWGLRLEEGIIEEIDLYKFEPWDLPGKSSLCTKDREWYFFNALDKKYSHGSRTNRATTAGYWKATGKDRKVCCGSQTVGMKKTLVFYLGRAGHTPGGERTDWIMHEFRLDEEYEKKRKNVCAVVLCRVHKKGGAGPRNSEQYGAPVVDDEDGKKILATEGIVTDSQSQKCLWFDSDDAQQDQSTLTTSPQISHAMEELSSGEEVQNFLQSLFSCESQDADLEMPPVTQLGLNPISKQGLNEEAWTFCSDHLPVMEEEIFVNQITDATSSESVCHPTIETCPTVPNNLDVDVNGLDGLHDMLHPAPDEPDILEGMLQTITDEGNSAPTMDSSLGQYDRTILQASVYHEDMVDDDYLELADLDYPLDDFFPTFPTHEDQEYPVSEEDTGIEIRSHRRLNQSILPGQGTAAWRVRLQTPAVPLTPYPVDRSIVNDDTLQHAEDFHNVDWQSPSFEVPVFTTGDLTNVLSVESQDAVNIYKSHNGDCSATNVFPGLGVAEPLPSNAQGFKFRRSMTDTSSHVVSDSKGVMMQQLQAVDSTFEDLLLENNDSMVKNSSSLSSACVSDSDTAVRMDASSVKNTSSEVQIIANTFSTDILSYVLAARDNLDSKHILFSGLQCPSLELADTNMESLFLDAISSFDFQGSSTLGIVGDGQINPLGSAAFIDEDGDAMKTTKQEIKLELESAPGQNHGRLASVLPLGQSARGIPSPGSSGQPSNSNPSNSNPINAPDVIETAASVSSGSASSSHGFQKSLLRFLKLLENIPASPALADELPLDMAQCTAVHTKPLAAELTLRSCSKAVTAGAKEAAVAYCCLKAKAEHIQATLPVRCLKLESPHLTCRVKSGPSLGVKLLQESPQIQSKPCLTMFSECKTSHLGESLTPIIFTRIRGQLYKSIRKGFKIITIRGSTSALIIFCLLGGFWWRLTKIALTTIFYQNCIVPVI